jgi:hypothetical protein
MSTKDQILSSALHGEALLTAKRPELQSLIDHLRDVAQGQDDIRSEGIGGPLIETQGHDAINVLPMSLSRQIVKFGNGRATTGPP